MNNLTAIIVSYNTCDLLQAAYESLRRFYPLMPVVIVDNSDLTNPCYRYARKIAYGPTRCVSNNGNFGHGPGMVLGISCVETEYFLLMDSDTEMYRSDVLEGMMEIATPEIYGVGQIMQVDFDGMNCIQGVAYLHPYFALVNKKVYQKFSPIINHGAPMLSAMIDLNENMKYNLNSFPVTDHVRHHERGTRKLNPRGFHPRFWDKV